MERARDWCHYAAENQPCSAGMCAVTQVLSCLRLYVAWQEKTTGDPFTLLGMAVKVVSLATSFAS